MTYRDGEREIPVFARAMQERLDANADKPGWQDEDTGYLLIHLREELEELEAEIRPTFGEVPWAVLSDDQKISVLEEAADVANFCLMIADRCGALELVAWAKGEE